MSTSARRWRAGWDEKENWQIAVKLTTYERGGLGDVGQLVLWVVQNAPFPPTVNEVVEQLMTDGDPFAPKGVDSQRIQVRAALDRMRRRGLVESRILEGRHLRWLLPADSSPEMPASLPRLGPKPISDGEWRAVRAHIPAPSRRRTLETATRSFLLAIIQEVSNDGPLLLGLTQQKRFLRWQNLRVWDGVATALSDRFSRTDASALEAKILAQLEP